MDTKSFGNVFCKTSKIKIGELIEDLTCLESEDRCEYVFGYEDGLIHHEESKWLFSDETENKFFSFLFSGNKNNHYYEAQIGFMVPKNMKKFEYGVVSEKNKYKLFIFNTEYEKSQTQTQTKSKLKIREMR